MDYVKEAHTEGFIWDADGTKSVDWASPNLSRATPPPLAALQVQHCRLRLWDQIQHPQAVAAPTQLPCGERPDDCGRSAGHLNQTARPPQTDPAILLHWITSTAKSRNLTGKLPIFAHPPLHYEWGHASRGHLQTEIRPSRRESTRVRDLRSGKVAITSQNHGFAVDADSLPSNVEVTHINLN